MNNDKTNTEGVTLAMSNSSDVVPENEGGKSEEVKMTVDSSVDEIAGDTKEIISDILDHVQHCPAVFKNQQMGDPELTTEDKRTLAQDLLQSNPSNFLSRFGSFLLEHHLNYFSSFDNPEVSEHARQVKMAQFESKKGVQQKNRRYEALKRLEAEGSYFSEAEMERREPLLYHQMVGQYLTEKEKLHKNRESKAHVIPTFLNFLIDQMEQDEVTALRKSQQKVENSMMTVDDDDDGTSEDESQGTSNGYKPPPQRWGDDWVDAENAELMKMKQKKMKKKKRKGVHLTSKEKELLVAEFKSFMHAKFLNGHESEFNYEAVDSNPDYDCLKTRSQDEEDKYFDEESCDGAVCTDTGIEDY